MIHRRRLHRLVPAAVMTACLATAGAASAQQGQMFGNTSGFNSLSSLNGTSVVPGAGSSAFGMSGSSLTPPSMGMNGLGMNSAGMTMGGGATGTSLVNQPRGLLGSSTTQNGMLGAAQQGATQGGMNRNGQGMNQGNRNQGNRNQNRGANRGNNQQQQQFANQGSNQRGNGSQRTIRPQLRVAFDSPRPKSEMTVKKLNTRFDGLSKKEGLSGVSVAVNDGKVTLRGQVNSEESRKLAGMLVALEPGVRSVQNDLTVAEPPAPGE